MRCSSAAALCLKSAWKPNSVQCSNCWRDNYLRTTLVTRRWVPKPSTAAVRDPMRAASARALHASSNFWSRSYSTAGAEAGAAGGDAGGRMRVAEGAARRLRALIRNVDSIRCRGTPQKLAANRQMTRRCVAGRQQPRAARSAGHAHPSQGPCRAATSARTFCARPATRRTTFSWRVRRAVAPVVPLEAASYRRTVVDGPDRQRAIRAPIARFLSQLRAQLLGRRAVPEKRLETKLNSM